VAGSDLMMIFFDDANALAYFSGTSMIERKKIFFSLAQVARQLT
jgi:hypothetical protein